MNQLVNYSQQSFIGRNRPSTPEEHSSCINEAHLLVQIGFALIRIIIIGDGLWLLILIIRIVGNYYEYVYLPPWEGKSIGNSSALNKSVMNPSNQMGLVISTVDGQKKQIDHNRMGFH